MELSEGKCTLCGVEEKVFNKNAETYIKQIQYAFFTRNKEDYSEKFNVDLALCVICVHRLQLSWDIKKAYDEMCNRNNKRKRNKCFFCESKVKSLIDMSDNVCDFQKKMRKFLNSVIVCHSYVGSSVCISCTYNLSIWSDLQTQIFLLMNLPEETFTLTNDKTSSPKMKRSVRAAAFKKNFDVKKNKNLDWLRKKFRHLKSVQKRMESESFTLTDKGDRKLLKLIPYVLITSSAPKRQHTVVIDDSSNESQTINLSIQKRNGKNIKKSPFKIKFSSSFSKSLTLRRDYVYTCDVCDKGFNVRCDYLLHLLKHEKMESMVINVTRYKLPDQIKADDFENTCKKQDDRLLSIPSRGINELLVKWVGEHAAGTFEESDKDSEANVGETADVLLNDESDLNENGEVTTSAVDVVSDDAPPIDSDHPNEIIEACNDEQVNVSQGDDISSINDVDEIIRDDVVPSNNVDTNKNWKQLTVTEEEANVNDINETQESDEVIINGNEEEVIEESTVDNVLDLSVTESNKTNESFDEDNVEKPPEATTRSNILSLKKPTPDVIDNTHEFSLDDSANNSKVFTCEDLLDILESDTSETTKSSMKKTTIHSQSDDDSNTEGIPGSSSSSDEANTDGGCKRKRSDDWDETPKRKRVRFASEKEIMTPDKSILLEKVSEVDDVVVAGEPIF